MQKLIDLDVNDKCVVKSIETDNQKLRRRLRDMGIIIGRNLEIKGKAPMGYPIDIYFAGYDLTLRKSEARCIRVEKIDNNN